MAFLLYHLANVQLPSSQGQLQTDQRFTTSYAALNLWDGNFSELFNTVSQKPAAPFGVCRFFCFKGICMSRNYTFSDQKKLYFVSFATVNWIDVFIRPVYKEIVVDSLNYCIAQKGLEVYAWCIMTSHVHLIIGSHGEPLEAIMRDLKRHTAKTILKAIAENPQESRKDWMLWHFGRAGKSNANNKDYQFWQQNNHPLILDSNFLLDQKLQYLHQNPVEAGIVAEPEQYLYSSAGAYAGGKGMVKLTLLE
jgi:putative transposase